MGGITLYANAIRWRAALRAAALLLALLPGFAAVPARAQPLITARTSVDNDSHEWPGGGRECAMSGDARFVAFTSTALESPVAASQPAELYLRDRDVDTDGVPDETTQPGAVTTTLLSRTPGGAPSAFKSRQPAMSANGRWVAFVSAADDLGPADTNGLDDVYIADRTNGQIIRASLPSGGGEPNGASDQPSLSADGRFLVFASLASNIVAFDPNQSSDCFLLDRDADTDGVFDEPGATQLIIVSRIPSGVVGNGGSSQPIVSGNGRFVAFLSKSSDLVAGDTNGKDDIFVFDRVAETVTLVSRASNNGPQGDNPLFAALNANPAISFAGRFVAFQSRSVALVPNDTNGVSDVFLVDRGAPDTGGAFPNASVTTEMVSVGTGGQQGNGVSGRDRVSINSSPQANLDGRFVAFESEATTLVPGDVGNLFDIYVRDRLNSTTSLYSVSLGFTPGNFASVNPTISADGSSVAFDSDSSNLVLADSNGVSDVFIRTQPPCLGPSSNPPLPLLSQDLADVTACEGDLAHLAVEPNVGATAPFSYRWQRDTVDLPGQPTTRPSIDIGPLTSADAGISRYRVVVQNSCGTQVSRLASLTVRNKVHITQQPVGTTACAGAPLNLSIGATGDAPLSFQWKRNGQDVPGATSATLHVQSASSSDSGNYTCVVTNPCGSLTSAAAVVSFSSAPIVTTQPAADQTVCIGRSFSLVVAVPATPVVTFQWKKNGNIIPGATTATFSRSSAATSDAGTYTCLLQNVCGSIETSPAMVDVRPALVITSQPANQVGCLGGTAHFTIGVNLPEDSRFRWRKGTTELVSGPNISGIDTATLTLTNLAASSAASNYNCLVAGPCNTLTSNSAGLRVDDPPSVTANPTDRTAAVGGSATFSLQARGGAPLKYQWRKNGTNIPNATASSYTVTPVATGSAGNYDCVVMNNCGSATSTAAHLTVTGGPTTQPGGGPGPGPNPNPGVNPCGTCGAAASESLALSMAGLVLARCRRRRRRGPRA
ncbi:MAG: immunoglobulin domain-containing protein [Phycisphaerae bacterium]